MRLTQLLATGLLVGGLASASTITVSEPIATFLTDATETASLPFFESAPGFMAGDVLTSVQIQFDAKETIESLNITNNSPSTEGFTFSAIGQVSSAGTAPGAGSIAPIALATFGPTAFSLAGHASITPVPPPVTTDFNSGLVLESNSAYDTTGTFLLGFTTLNGSTFLGGGNNETATLVTDAAGTVDVVYNFTSGTPPPPVPEPGSIFMVGFVLLFAGSLLRKRWNRA